MVSILVSNNLILYSLLSPILRISGYLSSMGVDFSWFGLPNYAFGSVIVSSLDSVGLSIGMVPMPSICNAVMLLALGVPKTKYVKNNGKIEENIYMNLNVTLDHRYFDGSYAAKLNDEFKQILENVVDDNLFTQ